MKPETQKKEQKSSSETTTTTSTALTQVYNTQSGVSSWADDDWDERHMRHDERARKYPVNMRTVNKRKTSDGEKLYNFLSKEHNKKMLDFITKGPPRQIGLNMTQLVQHYKSPVVTEYLNAITMKGRLTTLSLSGVGNDTLGPYYNVLMMRGLHGTVATLYKKIKQGNTAYLGRVLLNFSAALFFCKTYIDENWKYEANAQREVLSQEFVQSYQYLSTRYKIYYAKAYNFSPRIS